MCTAAVGSHATNPQVWVYAHKHCIQHWSYIIFDGIFWDFGILYCILQRFCGSIFWSLTFGVYVLDIDLLGSIFMCDLVQYPLGCLYVSRLFGSFVELL